MKKIYTMLILCVLCPVVALGAMRNKSYQQKPRTQWTPKDWYDDVMAEIAFERKEDGYVSEQTLDKASNVRKLCTAAYKQQLAHDLSVIIQKERTTENTVQERTGKNPGARRQLKFEEASDEDF